MENYFKLQDIIFKNDVSFRDVPKIVNGLKIIKGVQKDKDYSFKEVFEDVAQKKGNNNFLMFDGGELSYAQVNEMSNKVAHYLKEKGVHKGVVVSLFAENSAEFLIVLIALTKIGAVASLINTSLRGEALSHSIQTGGAEFFVASDNLVAPLSQQLNESQKKSLFYINRNEVYFDSQNDVQKAQYLFNSEVCKKSSENPKIKQKLDDVIMHIFTSGSTGMPKAALQTNRRWVTGYAGLGGALARLSSKDRLYVCLPFYHANAVLVSLGAVLYSGASLVVDKKFSQSNFWEKIKKFDVTAFSYIGEICNYLLSAPKSANDKDHKVRKVIGNGMKPSIWKDFQQRFDIPYVCEFYGASESPISFANVLYMKGTVGVSSLPFEIVKYDAEKEEFIRDKNNYLIPVKRGETGLLIGRKEKTFSGYSDPKKNESLIIKDAFKKGDEWINTGDLMINMGFRHARFADRCGDSYRWKGENTSATEVEKFLNQINEVDMSAVFGIKLDEYDGKAGFAGIQTAGVDVSVIYKHLKCVLQKASIPVFIRLVDNIELTETHKIKKTELKKKALSEYLDEVYVVDHKNETYRKITNEDLKLISEGELNI